MFVKPHGLGSVNADSEIRIVDRGFVVDRPWINHAEKVINHVLRLIGLLRGWLILGLIMHPHSEILCGAAPLRFFFFFK